MHTCSSYIQATNRLYICFKYIRSTYLSHIGVEPWLPRAILQGDPRTIGQPPLMIYQQAGIPQTVEPRESTYETSKNMFNSEEELGGTLYPLCWSYHFRSYRDRQIPMPSYVRSRLPPCFHAWSRVPSHVRPNSLLAGTDKTLPRLARPFLTLVSSPFIPLAPFF